MNAIRKTILAGVTLASLVVGMNSSLVWAQTAQHGPKPNGHNGSPTSADLGQLSGKLAKVEASAETHPLVQRRIEERLNGRLGALSAANDMAEARAIREQQRSEKWEDRKYAERVWREDRKEGQQLDVLVQEDKELAEYDHKMQDSYAVQKAASDLANLSEGRVWPRALVTADNKELCHRIQNLARRLIRDASIGKELLREIRDLQADLKKRAGEIRPADYIRAKQFLKDLADASNNVVPSELAIN